jgi:hypothetical protein
MQAANDGIILAYVVVVRIEGSKSIQKCTRSHFLIKNLIYKLDERKSD